MNFRFLSKRAMQATLLLVPFVWHLEAAFAQSQGKWSGRAPMPSARTEVAVVELAGKIYVIGGFSKSGDLVEEFDPTTNSWRRRASLPTPLHHVGAAAVGEKIYVVGGYTGRWEAGDTVYEYDPAADQWRARAPMPPRSAPRPCAKVTATY